MLREHLFDKRAPADPMFRWRGGDASRVEALSDAVFALTLTLLVATTHVPQTFVELWEVFLDLPVLAVCFTLLVLLWHDHYRFFRRYGLEDSLTTALNLGLLFLVLVFAYPLKFLFTFLWKALVLGTASAADFVPAMPPDMPMADLFANGYTQSIWIMYLYASGLAAVSAVQFLMHLRALQFREQLALDPIELALTRGSLRSHALTGGVAVLSLLVAGLADSSPLAGMVFTLLFPAHWWNGWHTGSQAERLKAELDSGADASSPAPEPSAVDDATGPSSAGV